MRDLPLRSLILFVACLVLGPLAGGASCEEFDLDAPPPADPAIVRRVTLENGFTYWIRPHRIPGNTVELALHVRAGSLDEHEDERGLAHFIEHMAFNGSTHFPPGEVVRFFESIGLTFGQHQNANTAYDRTQYTLSLPSNDPEMLEKALTFFADVAYGLTLSPKEVDAERAVILEEERARAGVQQRLMKRDLRALAPDALITHRFPIGVPDVIRGAPAATLRRFYERCYRPERTTLIVCGGVGPDTVEPIVRTLFGPWKPKGPAVAQPASGLKPLAALTTTMETDPDQDGAVLMLMRPATSEPDRTYRDMRADVVSYVGVVAAQMRWARLAERDGAFEGLSMTYQPMTARSNLAMAVIAGEPASWKKLTETLVRELRRLQEHGFDDDEIAFAKQILNSQIARQAEVSRTWNSRKQVQEMLDSVQSGDVPMAPRAVVTAVDRLLSGISKQEVEAAVRRDFALDGSLFAAHMPSTMPDAPTPAVLEAQVRKAVGAQLARTAEETAQPAALGPAPKPGTVASGMFDSAWGVQTWGFENGAIVRFRPMATPNFAMVRISLVGGSLDETAATRGVTEAAVLALREGTMASTTNSATRLRRHLLGLKVEVSTNLGLDRVVIDVSGAPAAIESGLRLVHHVLSAPKVEGPALKRWKQVTKRGLEEGSRSADAVASNRARAVATQSDPRLLPLTAEQVDRVTLESAQARARALTSGSPLEVAIVGQVSHADARRLASRWIGSLPARPFDRERLRALRKTGAATLPIRETVPVASSTDRAAVRLQWRGLPGRDLATRAALMHAGMILMTRLQTELREKRGLTYTAGASYQDSALDGLDSLVVMFTADPARAAEAAKTARDVTHALRDAGPTREEVTATAAQMRHLLQSADAAPGFWAVTLTEIDGRGLTLQEKHAEFAHWPQVDGTRIQKALKAVVREDRFLEILALPRK